MNVLPGGKWSKYTAAFPKEILERLITLYSYIEETMLDPFLGNRTNMCVRKKAIQKPYWLRAELGVERCHQGAIEP
jgi:DNA modification methylase